MTSKIRKFPSFPRIVRPAADPLGLYLRAGYNDHQTLLDLIASGDTGYFGIVFDPTKLDRHADLKEQVLKQKLDAVLDPRTVISATPGGYKPKLGALPWGVDRQHSPDDFIGTQGRRLVASLAEYVCEHGFTQVFSPTHLITSINDPWLPTDAENTRRLRISLDQKGGTSVQIIYQLAVCYGVLRNRTYREHIINTLRTTSCSSVWLLVDGFGSDSPATKLRTVIEAASDFHDLGVPILADHVGGVVGLALLAFGAVAGVSHGITVNERFAASALKRPPQPTDGFGLSKRVYIPAIDSLLKIEDAKALLESSRQARAYFGCTDTNCCPRGIKDMLENPERHFLYQRIQQIAELSQIPETLRPQRFLDQHLRPASDKAVAAANIKFEKEGLAKKMQTNRKRIDTLRTALAEHAEKASPKSFSAHPRTRVAREIR